MGELKKTGGVILRIVRELTTPTNPFRSSRLIPKENEAWNKALLLNEASIIAMPYFRQQYQLAKRALMRKLDTNSAEDGEINKMLTEVGRSVPFIATPPPDEEVEESGKKSRGWLRKKK